MINSNARICLETRELIIMAGRMKMNYRTIVKQHYHSNVTRPSIEKTKPLLNQVMSNTTQWL